MTELVFDKVNNVKIDYTAVAGQFVTITNVLAFAYRIVTVEEGMVWPIAVINDYNPSGVHHSHKYYEMLMVLDTDWLKDTADPTSRWAYGPNGQPVNAAGTKFAIDEDGANTAIEYFVVSIREHDNTATTLTFANVDTDVVWCVGEETDISNEDGTPHQTVTYRFICLGEMQ